MVRITDRDIVFGTATVLIIILMAFQISGAYYAISALLGIMAGIIYMIYIPEKIIYCPLSESTQTVIYEEVTPRIIDGLQLCKSILQIPKLPELGTLTKAMASLMFAIDEKINGQSVPVDIQDLIGLTIPYDNDSGARLLLFISARFYLLDRAYMYINKHTYENRSIEFSIEDYINQAAIIMNPNNKSFSQSNDNDFSTTKENLEKLKPMLNKYIFNSTAVPNSSDLCLFIKQILPPHAATQNILFILLLNLAVDQIIDLCMAKKYTTFTRSVGDADAYLNRACAALRV